MHIRDAEGLAHLDIVDVGEPSVEVAEDVLGLDVPVGDALRGGGARVSRGQGNTCVALSLSQSLLQVGFPLKGVSSQGGVLSRGVLGHL